MTRSILAGICLPISVALLFLAGCSVAETQVVPRNGNCSAPPAATKSAPAWDGWGADGANTRFQDARTAGLTRQGIPKLKLKWAFGFPGATEASTQPTIFGGRVFVGSRDDGADQRDSHVRHVLGGGGQVQFKLGHRGCSPCAGCCRCNADPCRSCGGRQPR